MTEEYEKAGKIKMAQGVGRRHKPKLDKETKGLLRQTTKKWRSAKTWSQWREAYAARTDGDSHDDEGVLGQNRGQNWDNRNSLLDE